MVIDVMSDLDLDVIVSRLITRYSNPARQAYTYLFRVTPDADMTPIFPATETVLAAWVDEGGGLQPVPTADALRLSGAVRESRVAQRSEHKLTSHERRQMMARLIVFSVEQDDEALIVVHLISRSLGFTPKGDREVYEHWRLGEEGWYSAYRPEGNTTA